MAPTNLLVNTRFIFILNKAKLFDCLIKVNIPSSWGPLKSINGSARLTYLSSILWIDKTFRLCHVHILIKASIKEGYLDIHLPDFIVIISRYCKQNLMDLTIGTGGKSFIIVNTMNLFETFILTRLAL